MKRGLGERLKYWFDNCMAAGTKGMACLLIGAMLLLVGLHAAATLLLGFQEEGGLLAALWDSFATTVNAEMPYSGDGKLGYVVLVAVSAVIGLLFTSVLIGIVNNAIEERLALLRKGNSIVVEKGHTVVLGFVPGEYTLLSQLVLAAEGERACLVVAENSDREEMEERIRENVEIPPNVRVICRKVDVCDPTALRICALESCKNIVVTPVEDGRTLKTLLAVSSVLGEAEKERIHIVAAVSRDEYILPLNLMGKNGILMLQTHDVAARVIAHACTQPGLSAAFTDIFNFEGSELYVCQLPGSEGQTFAQLMGRVDGGVPLGICHEGIITLNPNPNEVLQAEDSLLLFAENKEKPYLTERMGTLPLPYGSGRMEEEPDGTVLILGWNEVLDTVLQELPEGIRNVIVAGLEPEEAKLVQHCAEEHPERDVSILEGNLLEEGLEELVEQADHVVLLSDHSQDEESADIQSIRLLLRLRDIRARLNLNFSITAEMRRESNRNLVAEDDPTDFIVASNISSMVLAQVTENPMLYGVFQELLSNVGNELYLKTASCLGVGERQRDVAEVRRRALAQGYLLLGFIKQEQKKRSVFLDPPLTMPVNLRPEDHLIVIGQK